MAFVYLLFLVPFKVFLKYAYLLIELQALFE